MSTPTEHPSSGADFMRQFFPTSPYVKHLGMQLTDLQPGLATLTLPFTNALVTIGTVVHGGAIASLIDTAAMVAAWSDAQYGKCAVGRLRGPPELAKRSGWSRYARASSPSARRGAADAKISSWTA